MDNRYDKLHKEFLGGIEEIMKFTVNGSRHHDKGLKGLYNDSRFSKKLIRAFAKYKVLEF
ncbi:hypothetical protein [Wolbachia pipientis]|uniref:hypothetical protein n=1 Tax=Wolbachia pipientis TaxID=955 RepID=UPI0025A3F262|nr:hypothetical protein [Wolbachia pipientis]MDM8335340.1 hypothetical protein [Wolbachia pipientis]